MDSEKQIAEMANDLNDCITEFVTDTGDVYIDDEVTAQKMFDKGYRKQEWISVDERLPKHRQKVLVCDDRQNMVTAMYVTFDNGGFDWCTSVRLVYKVTHWMPLPEPPKMKGGE